MKKRLLLLIALYTTSHTNEAVPVIDPPSIVCSGGAGAICSLWLHTTRISNAPYHVEGAVYGLFAEAIFNLTEGKYDRVFHPFTVFNTAGYYEAAHKPEHQGAHNPASMIPYTEAKIQEAISALKEYVIPKEFNRKLDSFDYQGASALINWWHTVDPAKAIIGKQVAQERAKIDCVELATEAKQLGGDDELRKMIEAHAIADSFPDAQKIQLRAEIDAAYRAAVPKIDNTVPTDQASRLALSRGMAQRAVND